MRYRHKDPGELLYKAQSFSWRLEDRSKSVVIFPPNETAQPYTAHKSKRAFHETLNALQRFHERHNTDVTQMIF
jgi:hypothetical protein